MSKDDKSAIIEEYKEILKTNEDDKIFAVSCLKILKIYKEISMVEQMYKQEEFDILESLMRLEVLLGAMDEVRDDIKKSLL